MVLYIVGLGLSDEKDITIKGLEAVKGSEYVYYEYYTSILSVPRDRLEEFFGKTLIEADREMIESGCEEILERAKTS